MRPLTGMLLRTLRHAAVAVAVMSVLMMTLGIHLHTHADAGDGHGHGAELSLGSTLDDEPGAPSSPDAVDPDGCGHCHCPAPLVAVAESPAFVFHDQVAGFAGLTHPAAVPDSPSYPPDPPPVRLS